MFIDTPSGSDMENLRSFLKGLYPTAQEIQEYATPFLLHFAVRKEYEKYLIILTRLDVNGIEELSRNLSAFGDISVQNSVGMVGGIIEIFNKKYSNGERFPSTLGEFMEEFMNELSVDKMVPLQSEANEAMYKEYSEGFEKMDEKAEALESGDKDIYDYFCLLIVKLWLRMLLTNPKYPIPMSIFLKSFLLRYFKNMEALYSKAIPQELLTYIETIEIPREEELRSEVISETPKKAVTPPVRILPLFHKADGIYNVLCKHFDATQHELLRKVLGDGVTDVKLLFMGKANQLADAFKRLYTADLITGCTKDELIEWIRTTFEYKDSNRQGIVFTQKYLNDIISTEQKPCKNPIIEITKDKEGKVAIFSPDKQSKNYLKN